MPHFGNDEEGKETVAVFKKKIAASDCILIVCMDYPYNLPETVGNALKWAAADISGMPLGLITSDSGRYEIQHSLVTTLSNNGVPAREDNTLVLELKNMVTISHKEIVNLRLLEEIRNW